MKKVSLYIHIPFCEKRCRYCDFTTFTSQDHKIVKYIDALKKEIKLYAPYVMDYEVKSIFIGGGTPSYIDSEYIIEIVSTIRSYYKVRTDAEITIEANPGSLNVKKIRNYKLVGINRISLGAQSFNNEILSIIGRNHREEDIVNSIKLLKDNEIDNISLDLIFNLPGQTIEDSLNSINKAIKLGVDHVSHYGLIIEPTTSIYKDYISGKFKPLSENDDRKIYHLSKNILIENGFNHYEISNFAKYGKESIHNLSYWNIDPYIGYGVSASSNFGSKRFKNTDNIFKYIELLQEKKLSIIEDERIDKSMELKEYLIMGIRKIKGINIFELERRFNIDFFKLYGEVIQKNIKKGLINSSNGFINLTDKGMDLCNQVELDFYMFDCKIN